MAPADGMRMDTGATAHLMTRVAGAGDRMAAGWRRSAAQIADYAGQLGGGDLGGAFLAGYPGAAAETAAALDRCCQVPGQLAAAGRVSIAAYVTADQDAAGTFAAAATGTAPTSP